MSSSEYAKKVIAAIYLIAYVSTVLWAMGTSGRAGGGMAFVLPIILGFPWSLLLGLSLLVAPLPKIVTLVLLIFVPPAINVYLILRTRGIIRAKRDLNQSVAAKDSDDNDQDVP